MPDTHSTNMKDILIARKVARERELTLLASRKLNILLGPKYVYNPDGTTIKGYGSGNNDLGLLRSLIAPSDTAAFPTRVLSSPVYKDTSLYNNFSGAVGIYDPKLKAISLLPERAMHQYTQIGKGLGNLSPYATLLHEAGHARGYSNEPNLPVSQDFLHAGALGLEALQKKRYLLSEDYANALADSLLKARGLK